MGKFRVVSVGYTTPSIIQLVLKLTESEKPFSFLPGQYAAISFKNHGRSSAVRCFSLASSPTDSTQIEFGIRVAGKFTKALAKLKIGEIVEVDGPYGNFIFNPALHTNTIMCAGGIGITPFMSALRYASTLQLKNNLTLIVGAREANEIPYFEELQSIASNNENIRIVYVIGSGPMPNVPSSQQVFSGRVTQEILFNVSQGYTNPTYFICGPPPYMKSVTDMLVSNGTERSNIITEAFSQGNVFKMGNTRDWPSTIYMAGAFGAFILSGIVMTTEMLKHIAPTLLPDTLAERQQRTVSARQKDLDAKINELRAVESAVVKSPTVLAAEKEVSDAEAKIAQINNTSVTRSVSATPANTPVASTPKTPQVAPPVCTTSASGVRVCQ